MTRPCDKRVVGWKLLLMVTLILGFSACGSNSSSSAPPQVAVSISPGSSSVSVGGKQQFAATVTGSSNTAVTWAVQESNGGAVDASGNYTAPLKAGSFHIVATSQADPSKSASAGVTVTAPAPVFSTTPPTGSAEGNLYSYAASASDPAGTAVTLSLTTAPSGAQMSGPTITWTPTWNQSRTPNAFVVTATSAAGGTATQSWTLSPNGTVYGHYFLHFWGGGNDTVIPERDFSLPPVGKNPTQILIWAPQPDGTLSPIPGVGFADGTFQFPGVPAGNYLMSLYGQLSLPYGTWENTSTLYFDADANGYPPLDPSQWWPEALVINVGGFDPIVYPTDLIDIYDRDGYWDFLALFLPSGTTSYSYYVPSLLENAPSVTDRFVSVEDQGVQNTLPFTSAVMGPAWVQPFSQISDGTTATFAGDMTRTLPGSLDLNVSFSSFANAFAQSGPTSASLIPYYFDTSVISIVKVPKTSLSDPIMSGVIPIFADASIQGPTNPGDPDPWPKDANGNDTWPPDQSYGTLTYNDPLGTSEKTVYLTVAAANLSIPVPGMSTPMPWTQYLAWETTTSPNGPISAVMLPPANGNADGVNFATGGTVTSTTPTLKWDAPSAAPNSPTDVMTYNIFICAPQAGAAGTDKGGGGGSCATSLIVENYPTNSFVVPPGILQSGNMYLVSITATSLRDLDLTNPHRYSYPIAQSSVVSAPISVQVASASAQRQKAAKRSFALGEAVNAAPLTPLLSTALNRQRRLRTYSGPIGYRPNFVQLPGVQTRE